MSREIYRRAPPPHRNEVDCRKWVTGLYRGILKREPDPGGLDHYSKRLFSGELSLSQLVRILYRSSEYQRATVRRVYRQCLFREPTAVELAAAEESVDNDCPGTDELSQRLRSSAEGLRMRRQLARMLCVVCSAGSRRPGWQDLLRLFDRFRRFGSNPDAFRKWIRSREADCRRRIEPITRQLFGRQPKRGEILSWRFFLGSDAELFKQFLESVDAGKCTLDSATEIAKRFDSGRRRTLVHVMIHPMDIGGAERLLSYWDQNCDSKFDYLLLYPIDKQNFEGYQFENFEVIRFVDYRNLNAILHILEPTIIIDHTVLFHPQCFSECYAGLEPVIAFYLHSWELFNTTPVQYAKNWGIPVERVLASTYPSNPVGGWEKVRAHSQPLAIDLEAYPFQERAFETPIRVGIVGRIAPDKMPASFIRKLAAMQVPHHRFLLCGRGEAEYFEFVHNTISSAPHICHVGVVTPDRMAAVYSLVDVLLCASPSETGGYALLEAMACGVPVIARRTETIEGIVGAGGKLSSGGDWGLIDAVLKLTDPLELRRLSRAARAKVEYENSDLEALFSSIHLFLYREVVASESVDKFKNQLGS